MNTLKLVKPERATKAEDKLIGMARTGQLSGKLSDEELRDFLAQFPDASSKQVTVKFDRRRNMIDSDED